jgi:hypothetical protein
MVNILSHFPDNYTPTPNQVDTLQRIEKALKKNTKVIIINAPTGSGKSLLAKTLQGFVDPPTETYKELINSYAAFKQDYAGNYINEDECNEQPPHGAFVLTITKALQQQYQQSFNDTAIVKGKSNYTCDVDSNFDVDTAPCLFISGLKDKCQSNNRCSYYNARNHGLISSFSALNYKMFLTLPGHVKRKNIIICDEASELEEELVKMFSADILYSKLKYCNINYKPLLTDNYDAILPWLTDIKGQIEENIDHITQKVSKSKQPISQVDRVKLTQLRNIHNSLCIVQNSWTQCEYVVDRTADGVSLTPLKVDNLSSSIFDYADRIILMSATIIDPKNYAKTLGIKDYEYIEVESTFEASKSPIYVASKYKLNYSNINRLMGMLTEEAYKICKHHANQKGVIHTHSMEICNYLQKKAPDNRFLFRSDKETNEDILKKHLESLEPTVLVSPSLTYGVDLKDDLARFQILIKMPFLPLANKRIKRLFELDKEWYENKMLNTLVQACGRSTRSTSDHSVTYILDGNIIDILMRCKHKLPKHFVDRFH